MQYYNSEQVKNLSKAAKSYVGCGTEYYRPDNETII